MMSEVRPKYDSEIDLLEFFDILWDGKWKIAGAVLISLLGVLIYQFVVPHNFKATTKIKQITSVEADQYQKSNAVGFFEVSPSLLLSLYIEELEERSLFEDAIKKYKLLDAANYENENDFNESVIALASSIKLIPPINVDGEKKGDIRRFWTITFKFNDESKWRQVLSHVNSSANLNVRKFVKQRFETLFSVAQQEKDFELEDIATQIENTLSDYDRVTSDRLEYLREQAAIARKLGVSKNTIEVQTFNAQNGMVANVKTDTPFYLRGFEAIEKEIELIESRSVKEAFVSELFELEQQQRTLEQDKTLERAETLFASTPIMSSDAFSASSLKVHATDFKYNNKMLYVVLSIVFGGMTGAVYVLVSNSMRKRKEQTAEA